MGAYYPDDYGRMSSLARDFRVAVGASLARRVSLRVAELQSGHSVNGAGSMLEIGCASGAFLQEMKEKGWRVEGIEFSNSAAAAARRRVCLSERVRSSQWMDFRAGST